jgi:hypothetical protein
VKHCGRCMKFSIVFVITETARSELSIEVGTLFWIKLLLYYRIPDYGRCVEPL